MSLPLSVLLGAPALAGALALVLTQAQVQLNGVLRLTAAPRNDRWHRKPTPSSGGIAVFFSCAVAYLAFFRGQHVAEACGAAALWLLGFVDDRLRLRASVKFTGQVLVTVAVMASGVVFAATSSSAFNILFTFFWLIGITNAFNLIDNMDGLCAGVIVIICAFRCVLLASHGYSAEASLRAVIGAAFLAFLVFNYNPAKIFMGDCGSMFAGFLLASLSITSPLAHTKAFVAGIFYPALTYTYPIFDTILVTVLRKIAGRPISVGGRDHSSHRLASLGLNERQVVWILWLLTALGSGVGFMASWMPLEVIAACGALMAALMVFGIFLATLPAYPLPDRISWRGGSWLRQHIPSLRAATIIVLDMVLAGLALFLAFLLGFESRLAPADLHHLLVLLPIVMAAHGVASFFGRSHAISWRLLSLADVGALGRNAAAGAACAFTIAWLFDIPRFAKDTMLLYLLVCVALTALLRGGLGALNRLTRNTGPARVRVAVYGADASGELAATFLERHPSFNFSPVVFVDPRRERAGMSIHGLPVRRLDHLKRVAAEDRVAAVFVGGRQLADSEHLELEELASSTGLSLLALDVSIRQLARKCLT
jgi:UDP-GlcNAc:undecaprenyl-phosphate GlcNAc-1-phosphate transferase